METPANKSQTSVTSPAIISSPTNLMTQSNLVPANGNLISLNASSQIPSKFMKNGGNYASWKSQMTNLFFDYGLFDFVDGSRPCPSQTDPGYLFWICQNRLVLLAIQATFTAPLVQPLTIVPRLPMLGTNWKLAMLIDPTLECNPSCHLSCLTRRKVKQWLPI
ncbi:hypothetical protein ACOSQ4_002148 [Xanthoceras sorbifolium]